MTIYDEIARFGYHCEPAPRLNPSGSLYGPWRCVSRHGETVLRGDSRDHLEERLPMWWMRRNPSTLDR